ncbi:MAG: hypothetical protein GY696_34755 [Gammaproteobacteria bacterium]|nr:hypothetical protein [Gammaproteobacteria bacterium]
MPLRKLTGNQEDHNYILDGVCRFDDGTLSVLEFDGKTTTTAKTYTITNPLQNPFQDVIGMDA